MKKGIKVGVFAVILGTLSAGCGADAGSDEHVGESRAAVVGVDTFLYFRSNATGWGVDESTRLLPFAGVFARAVNVSQPWMLSTGDTAIVTQTNQLDGWGTSQTYSGAHSNPLLEPSIDTLVAQAPGGDAHFNVKYSSTGLQRVFVDPNSAPPRIGVEPITCPACPSELHCAILPNSQPTCQ